MPERLNSLNVRISSEELGIIKQDAERREMDVSTYVRDRLCSPERREQYREYTDRRARGIALGAIRADQKAD